MDDEIYTPQGFWVSEDSLQRDLSASGIIVGDFATEWWVRVRMANGGEGWIRWSDEARVDGLVACP
jgi:hypothetical protein